MEKDKITQFNEETSMNQQILDETVPKIRKDW